MPKPIKYSVAFLLFLCFACSSDISKKKEGDFSYKKVSIEIVCPNNAYYIINLASNGEGNLAFCFDRADSLELMAGKTDSLMNTAAFHISQVDLQIVDTIISSLPIKIDSRRPRDTFKYILKIDDEIKLESSDDKGYVYRLLKVLVPYFPKDESKYDFCEFFNVFKNINT